MFSYYLVLTCLSLFAYSKAGVVKNGVSDSHLIRCSIWDYGCQKKTAQMTVPLLAEGLPDLGTRRLDPLREPLVVINQDGVKKDLHNFELCGFANSVVNKANFDIHSKTYRIRFIIPVLTVNATYVGSGFLHELPFNGQGDMYLRANDVEVDAIINFDLREDNKNRKFAEVTNYFYSIEVLGDGMIMFENLNKDNPKMGAAVVDAIHKHWKAMTSEFGKSYFNPLAEAAVKALSQYLHYLDLHKIYTDI